MGHTFELMVVGSVVGLVVGLALGFLVGLALGRWWRRKG